MEKKTEIQDEIILNGNTVEWTNEWPYLGVQLNSAKTFNCSVKEKVRKFYRSVNAILRIDGRSNDMVMLSLLETHCVPILTYGVEVIHVHNADERRQMRVAYNSIYCKLFGYRCSQSVTQLQNFLGRPTWEQLVEKRKISFFNRILNCQQYSLARALLF